MRVWSVTDVGLVRRENQDACAYREKAGYTLCVVCDGMGGPAGGRIAGELAVKLWMEEMEQSVKPGMGTNEMILLSRNAVQKANNAIWTAAAGSPAYVGMGTTLVSAVCMGDSAVITNVGDSRCYLCGGGTVQQVTKDHSLVQDMVDRGDITEAEARIHPNRNVITRALGPDSHVHCDSFLCHMERGRYLLLCTDGLTNTVTEEELAREIPGGDPDTCLERLLRLSLERGAPDNVTAVLLERK